MLRESFCMRAGMGWEERIKLGRGPQWELKDEIGITGKSKRAKHIDRANCTKERDMNREREA